MSSDGKEWVTVTYPDGTKDKIEPRVISLSSVLQAGFSMSKKADSDSFSEEDIIINLREPKEPMQCLFSALSRIFEEDRQRDPLIPAIWIKDVAVLADKYDVTTIFDGVYVLWSHGRKHRDVAWHCLLWGIANKRYSFCHEALDMFGSGVNPPMPMPIDWTEEQAGCVGIHIYWSLVKAGKDCKEWADLAPDVDWKSIMADE